MKATVLLLAAGLLASGCSRSGSAPPAAPPTAQAQLVQSASVTLDKGIESTGTIRAKESVVISAQIPARIRRMDVRAGDFVRAGQVLVTLEDAAMQSALNQALAGAAAARQQELLARSDASLADQTLARYQMLRDQKSVTPQEFDEIRKRAEAAQLRIAAGSAQSEQAQAAVAGARTQLGYAVLRAPFAGVVTARMADPGTLAAPGIPLLQVDRSGPLQVQAAVDESLIGSVRVGMQLPASVAGMDLQGRVAEMVPAADPASRSFLIKIDLPPRRDLRAGMYATVKLPGSAKSAILAPQSAVAVRGSLACVYALDANGLAQLRYVTLGDRHGEQVEVLSGLASGERLVNHPGDRDWAGRRIEVQP